MASTDPHDGSSDRWLRGVVALLCVFAAGVSATTLNSTLSTDPDDVIELEYDKLPIGKGETSRLERQVESNRRNEDGASAKSSNEREQSGDSTSAANERQTSSDSRSADEGGTNTDRSSSAGDSERRSGSSGGRDRTGGSALGSLGLWALLLSYLRRLLPLLVAALVLWLAYRYRERLRALAALLRRQSPGLVATSEDGGSWSPVPSNDVQQAWVSMVRRADVDRPWTKTPAECAAAVEAAGGDPDAVRTITETFESVRYGDAPVTDERRRRVRDALDRVTGQERGS